MKCIHCQSNAARTTKGLPCCELRTLAQAPQSIIDAHSHTLTRVERETLPLLLWIERQRLKPITSRSSQPWQLTAPEKPHD